MSQPTNPAHERSLDGAHAPRYRTSALERSLVRAMARRCGLEDPGAFALAGGVAASGRTTRMLLQALCALECGCTVEIVCADQGQAMDLRPRLFALASRAGIPHESIAGRVRHRWPDYQPHGEAPADLVLVDHYAAERAKAQALTGVQCEPLPISEWLL